MASAAALKIHTTGFSTRSSVRIGPITTTAQRSGKVMAMRFGIRSANWMNSSVTTRKEPILATRRAWAALM
ncbi:hypothetical protein D3C71_1483900 [compost metagenome]